MHRLTLGPRAVYVPLTQLGFIGFIHSYPARTLLVIKTSKARIKIPYSKDREPHTLVQRRYPLTPTVAIWVQL